MPDSYDLMDRPNHNQIVTKTQMVLRPPLFVFRMSAFGDILIAAKCVVALTDSPWEPVFVVGKAFSDAALFIPGLRYCVVVENGPRYYHIQCAADGTKYLEEAEFPWKHKECIGLDLQKTSRSRRAQAALKQDGWQLQTHFVDKQTLQRFVALVRARLNSTQTPGIVRVGKSVYGLQQSALQRLVRGIGERKGPWLEFGAKQLSTCYPQTPLIIFAPGASGPLKLWGVENFRRCAEALLAQTQARILCVGGPDEVNLAEQICAHLGDRIASVAGKLTLFESMVHISRAHYVVACDSFAAHAAAGFGVPATVVFGGTSPVLGFAAPGITVRSAHLACSPCTRHGKGVCRFGNMACMAMIKSEDVVADVVATLQK